MNNRKNSSKKFFLHQLKAVSNKFIGNILLQFNSNLVNSTSKNQEFMFK